ncbi:hypothetical protein FB451DRAFT_1418052 [Mycena latifolia]|nr:hypothetical protein FB451DRAFT_1418052 [Mycena latifolia]
MKNCAFGLSKEEDKYSDDPHALGPRRTSTATLPRGKCAQTTPPPSVVLRLSPDITNDTLSHTVGDIGVESKRKHLHDSCTLAIDHNERDKDPRYLDLDPRLCAGTRPTYIKAIGDYRRHRVPPKNHAVTQSSFLIPYKPFVQTSTSSLL